MTKISTHKAYAVKREGQIVRWLEIGVATTHDDGQGFNVLLDRLPVGGFNGHVIIRANDANPPGADELGPASPSSS